MLDRLLVLREVEHAGSFRLAATQLGVTPSAVSQSVAALERELGARLVERGANSMSLTASGQAALRDASALLGALDTFARGETKEQKQPRAVHVRVGVYESMARYRVLAWIHKAATTMPDSRWSLRTGRSSELARGVATGRLDFAILSADEYPSPLEAEVLIEDGLGLFVRADLPEPTADTLPLIAGLLPGPGGLPGFYQRFVDSFEQSIAPSLRSDSFQLLVALVEDGCAAVLPLRVAEGSSVPLRRLRLPQRKGERGRHGIALAGTAGVHEALRASLANYLRSHLDAFVEPAPSCRTGEVRNRRSAPKK